jgi:hypothetical protein
MQSRSAKPATNPAGEVLSPGGPPMPSYSVPANGGRSYDYLPAVILSTKLKRDVEDAVLPAFEAWEHNPARIDAP